jgi:hypothetical protein
MVIRIGLAHISGIRLEFLANPDNRMAALWHEAEQFIDRQDQRLSRGVPPFLQKIIQRVDDHQDGSWHGYER